MDQKFIEQLSRLSKIALFTLIPLTLAFMITSYFSGSLTIEAIALDCAFSIIVQLFTYHAIQVMLRSNNIKFPHGTGRLENFSGFLYGALIVPVSIFILSLSLHRLLFNPTQVSFSIAQLPMIPSIIRSIFLYTLAKKIRSQFESPIAETFVIDQRVAIKFDASVILAILLGYFCVKLGFNQIALYLDPIFSILIALYMFKTALRMLLNNFKVLIDLPMPEEEQILLIRTLAREFESYDSIGSIYTRRSGMFRFVEIELFLNRSTSVSAISEITTRIEQDLKDSLDNIKLKIIALPSDPKDLKS
jgi:cation diffusion facilitator family transporter